MVAPGTKMSREETLAKIEKMKAALDRELRAELARDWALGYQKRMEKFTAHCDAMQKLVDALPPEKRAMAMAAAPLPEESRLKLAQLRKAYRESSRRK